MQLHEEKIAAIQEKLELSEQKLAQFSKLPEMEEELKARMEALTQVGSQVGRVFQMLTNREKNIGLLLLMLYTTAKFFSTFICTIMKLINEKIIYTNLIISFYDRQKNEKNIHNYFTYISTYIITLEL